MNQWQYYTQWDSHQMRRISLCVGFSRTNSCYSTIRNPCCEVRLWAHLTPVHHSPRNVYTRDAEVSRVDPYSSWWKQEKVVQAVAFQPSPSYVSVVHTAFPLPTASLISFRSPGQLSFTKTRTQNAHVWGYYIDPTVVIHTFVTATRLVLCVGGCCLPRLAQSGALHIRA